MLNHNVILDLDKDNKSLNYIANDDKDTKKSCLRTLISNS